MDPKMTARDAADFLGISTRQVYKRLVESQLPFQKTGSTVHFGYPTARHLFRLSTEPTAVSFQIVKGGTGKTSLASSVAVRANLYGLRVLCIDLDQQANLTSTFGVNADSLPVMIDILAEGYSYDDAITRVYPGMDLLASRIENALLDDVINLKKFKLEKVYRLPLQELKQKYDLIVIDCPPNLGKSVTAVTLGVDRVVAPVVPDSYSLAGLRATQRAINELEARYDSKIKLIVTANKYDKHAALSREALANLSPGIPYVHYSEEFANAIAHAASIFDTTKNNQAKRDIDKLTRELLKLEEYATHAQTLEATFY
jgi:chromosome partitioning protein